MDRYTAYDDSGIRLNAEIFIEHHGEFSIYKISSRGGKKNSAQARNPDYQKALDHLLCHLKQQQSVILDVAVNSARLLHLPATERRVVPEGFDYPIRLASIKDVPEFRKKIGRSVAAIGRDPTAKGQGNPTKAIQITISKSNLNSDFSDQTSSFHSGDATRAGPSGPPPSTTGGCYQKTVDIPGCVYVLILKGVSEDILKVGYTGNLKRRLKEHNKPLLTSITKLKWELHKYWEKPDLRKAYDLEQEIHSRITDYKVQGEREIFNIPITRLEEEMASLNY